MSVTAVSVNRNSSTRRVKLQYQLDSIESVLENRNDINCLLKYS